MTDGCARRELARTSLTEGCATGAVLFVVVASGARVQRLAPDHEGLQLLVNSLATVAVLSIVITIARPLSGAYLNPAAVAHDVIRKRIAVVRAAAFIGAQIFGASLGVLLANALFDDRAVQFGTRQRADTRSLVGELIATALLLQLGALTSWHDDHRAAHTTALFVGIGFWVTPSTAFINPAATIGRSLTDTYAGIAPTSAVAFVVVQLGAAVVSGLAMSARDRARRTPTPRTPSRSPVEAT